MDEPRQAAGARTTLAALAAGALFALLAMATQNSYGMCWDEGYYWPAYRDVAAWYGSLLPNLSDNLSYHGINQGWERIHELPPLTKWIGAVASSLAPAGMELAVLRVPSALMFGATCAMILLLAARRATLAAGIVAAIVYGMHPRLFGHAHFAASETLFAFLTVCTAMAATREMREGGRRALLALLAGLALATKVNALVLMVALAVWLLARDWICRRDVDGESRPAAARRGAVTLACVLAGAPVVAFAMWPWMWHDTGARLAEYWMFIREHSHQGLWYLGRKWNFDGPRAPWHFPLAMTLVASPVAFLAFVAAGIAAFLRALLRLRGRIDSDDLLLGLLACGPFAASMLPSSPKYDGLRLFLPAFAPLTVLAGVHAGRMLAGPRARFALAGIAALAFVEFAAGGWRDGLSYYNAPTRLATPDGDEFPFEATYWGEAITPSVWRDIEAIFPAGEVRIRPLALHGAVFEIERAWGTIPARFTFPPEPPYDAHLLLNRKGFWSRTEWWFAVERQPLASWPEGSETPRVMLYDGLPPFTTPQSSKVP